MIPNLAVRTWNLAFFIRNERIIRTQSRRFRRAIEITPLPAEAHYRLGQVYGRMGEAEKAGKEIELFKQISEQKKSEAERERHKIQQFVYTLRSQSSSPVANSEPH